MGREKITAVILGVLMGIISAFLLISYSNKVKLNKKKLVIVSKQKTIKAVKNRKAVQSSYLQIILPSDNTVVNKKEVNIKGEAPKDSLIVIQSPIQDLVFKNKKKLFSKQFPLAIGENVIRVNVYNRDIQTGSLEKEIKVYYLETEK